MSRGERRAQGSQGPVTDQRTNNFNSFTGLMPTVRVRGSVPPEPIAPPRIDPAALPPSARYSDGPLLGTGGMGKVFLAQDSRVGREVALKQLHAERQRAPEHRARFMREARVQGQLEHPSIVPVYDIDCRADGTMFFTMRRILGRTLNEILDQLRSGDLEATSRFTQRELLTAFATVCLAIDYAHSRGVVHRDLKPANIMLGDFGEVYVLDWGVARLMVDSEPNDDSASRLSIPGQLMGTLYYMAPEQMSGEAVTPVADVFSLGAILFELLTLCPLRTHDTLFLPVEARPSVRAPERGIGPELEAILVAATESEPSQRIGSARVLHDAITRYLEGDRAVVQRGTLAAQHAEAATAALARAQQPGADYERERGTAMTELVRALALDPSNTASVASLAQLLASPPRNAPPAVREHLAARDDRATRLGARNAWLACLLSFVLLPVMWAVGIREPLRALAMFAPVGIAMVVSLIAMFKRGRVPVWMQLTVIVCLVGASTGLSQLFGPLVLMPTVLATLSMVFQAHPSLAVRTFTCVVAAIALIAPTALELVGVIPSSYAFSAGSMTILPHTLVLSPTGATVVLLGGSLLVTIVPCLFISRLRSRLSVAERRGATQVWHFRRIAEQLVSAASAR